MNVKHLIASMSVLLLCACAGKRSDVAIRFPSNLSLRIAVLPFDSSNPYISGATLGDYVTVQILHTIDGMQVIERKDLMKVLQEQKLSLSGIIQSEKFSQLGTILGVDAILIGSTCTLETLQSDRGSISVTAKLMEVSTGRILWADRQKISYRTLYTREVPAVADALMEKSAQKIAQKMEKIFNGVNPTAPKTVKDPASNPSELTFLKTR